MPEFDSTNKGGLFKNDKGGNEARPDYTGQINVDGKEYRLAAWIKVSQRTGQKFLSLNVQPKIEQPAEPAKEDDPIADSIPFNTDR